MPRHYTIIISLITILLLLGVLAYLHFSPTNSSPTTDDVFSNLEFDESGTALDNTDGAGANGLGDVFDDNPSVALQLRQLTTRNVAGYQEVLRSTTTNPVVYIAESGVGHIYEINLEQGTENRISATTIPDTREAVFSEDGSYVAIKTSDSGGLGNIYLSPLDQSGDVVTTFVESNVSALTIIDDKLLYAVHNSGSVTVDEYALASGKVRTLFIVPFKEATIVFGKNVSGPHLAYPKSSTILESFVYEYRNQKLTRLPIDGYSLSAIPTTYSVVATVRDEATLTSFQYDLDDKTTTELSFVVVPEKCVGTNGTTLVCGHDQAARTQFDATERWLQGAVSFRDSLWSVREGQKPQQLIDIEAVSGRAVDVIQPNLGTFTDDLYFKNKVDQTLWWYNLSESAS